MSSADKKAYLSQYKTLDRRINRMLEELARWRSKAVAITQTYSDMPRGGAGEDKMATTIEHIVEMEQEINANIGRLVALRHEIEGAIARIQDDRLREIMRYRYIDGHTWERIAVDMHYSYMQICRLHIKALDVIECYTRSVL